MNKNIKNTFLAMALILSLIFTAQAKADQPQCVINNFSISPGSVAYGTSATITWDTDYCTNISIYGGTLNGQINLPSSGMLSTSGLYNTTTFTINASSQYNYASNQNATVYVTGQYNYQNGYSYGYNSSPLPTYVPCVISSFSASPSSVMSGGRTTLSWDTVGCTSVKLTGPNIQNSNQGLNGSTTTGVLYGPSTYILSASGDNPNYSYNSFYTNQVQSADTKSIIILINPGTSGQSTTPVTINTPTSVVTGQPTSIRSTSARLNGLFSQSPSTNATVFFQWGTDQSFYTSTKPQSTGSVSYTPFFDTIINLYPNTRYYYRAAVTTSTGTVYGSTQSFMTPSTPVITEVVETKPVTETSSGIGAGTNLVSFGIMSAPANVCVNNSINYTITYQNISTQVLSNSFIQVIIPAAIDLQSTSSGTYNKADHTVTLSVGTLSPGQGGSMNISGVVTKSSPNENMVVVNATMAFTNSSNGSQESAVAYALNNTNTCQTQVDSQNNLTGLALFSSNGFWPNNLVGWLIAVLCLVGLIYLVRIFMTGNTQLGVNIPTAKKNVTSNTYTENTNTAHTSYNPPSNHQSDGPHYEEMHIPVFEDEE